MEPTPGQLQALKAIVCHVLAGHYRDVIAYGAGWTDQERQQPVGDTGRHEPRHPDAILDAELQHALEDPDPLKGIAQLTARWAAAFVLDPDGITRTKALGSDERMRRKLTDALPGGPARCAPPLGVRGQRDDVEELRGLCADGLATYKRPGRPAEEPVDGHRQAPPRGRPPRAPPLRG